MSSSNPVSRRLQRGLARVGLALGLGLTLAVQAVPVVVTPAKGRDGTSVRIEATGLVPNAAYDVDFAGIPVTQIVRLNANASGRISATQTLPNLPMGSGKIRISTVPFASASVVVGTTAFTSLAPLQFVPPANVHAGQMILYQVTGLQPGTVTVLYENVPVAGPVAISGNSYTGKFAVPIDRPQNIPGTAHVRVINKVGLAVVNQLDTEMAVLAKPNQPFTFGYTQPPPLLSRAGQPFSIAGVLEVAANEQAPEQLSLWYQGDDGAVFPMGATATALAPQSTYAIEGAAPGLLSMTAGHHALGLAVVVGAGRDSFGRPALSVSDGTSQRFDQLPPDRWQVRVRVTRQNGTPIPGAIVVIEGAPVVQSQLDSEDIVFSSLDDYAGHSLQATQVGTIATDPQGCPLTLSRKLSDANGIVEFEFEEDDLQRYTTGIDLTDCNAGGSCPLTEYPISLRLGIDASAEGYGYQVSEGPNQGDFLPHIYNIAFYGVNDGDPTNDITEFRDYYQDVVVLVDDRASSFTQPLPAIDQKVGIYDVAILPWVGRSQVLFYENGDEGVFPVTRLNFGPINSKRNINPAWIVPPPNSDQAFPTQITVRTDPAVSTTISSARLYFDSNRNGTPEYVADFSSSGPALDCSIQGLDKSLTWRANLPANLASQSSGLIEGYIQFIGTPASSGQAEQRISITMLERDVGWLSDHLPDNSNKYSEREIMFPYGAQNFIVSALEDSPDTSAQLPSNPGHQIGRLKSVTSNSRLISTTFDKSGNRYLQSILDGAHQGGGHPGMPTTLEQPIGYTTNTGKITLIDQSFPLFYYVWGVPMLAGVEFGADFNLLSEISMSNRVDFSPRLEPVQTLTTTPSLDMGLNFYLDLDVLFDLVDGGVDLDAIFELDMPIHVVNGVTQPIQPELDALLVFSWHFEVFCLPLDFICDALNDIEGSEILLPTSNQVAALEKAKSGVRELPISRSRQTALTYSRSGAGQLAFTSVVTGGQSSPRLLMRPIGGGDFNRSSEDVELSNAPGIRSVAVEFINDNEALAVWAESADTYAQIALMAPLQRLARQRLMFSFFNGETWSPKAQITPPSGGEGGVDLASCTERPGTVCPVDGEILAVWTRDMAGDITQHRTRVYSSFYKKSRGWSAPQPVDASGVLDSAPSATYVDGKRVVAFVRSTSGVFGDTDARRIAYRFLEPGATVQVPAELPGGVAWPSILAQAPGEFVIAHTYANDPSAFVGNTQRIALAFANQCGAGSCTVVPQSLTDVSGRPIYGERPTALIDNAGNVSVVMRGTGFGTAPDGVQTTPDDPIGMVAHTGELISLAISRGQPTSTPMALSNDGAVHFAPAAAFDPRLGQIATVATRGLVLPGQMRDKLKSAGIFGSAVHASATVVDGAEEEAELVVYSATHGVDFAIESVSANSNSLVAGQTVVVKVELGNVGAEYVSASPAWQLVLSFDAPFNAGGHELGGRFLPSLASGQSVTLTTSVLVPAGFSPDQVHRLYAQLLQVGNPVDDVNDANNMDVLDFGGMPMPFGLQASAVRGTRLVQLTWDEIEDPNNLIAGYRIWFHDGDGQWKHMGSSFVTGFLDLTAKLGVERHYRVTSYSAKTIESPPSSEAVAIPKAHNAMFGDGFE